MSTLSTSKAFSRRAGLCLSRSRRTYSSSPRCSSSLFNLRGRAISRENQWFSKVSGISQVEHSPALQLLRAEGELATGRANEIKAISSKEPTSSMTTSEAEAFVEELKAKGFKAEEQSRAQAADVTTTIKANGNDISSGPNFPGSGDKPYPRTFQLLEDTLASRDRTISQLKNEKAILWERLNRAQQGTKGKSSLHGLVVTFIAYSAVGYGIFQAASGFYSNVYSHEPKGKSPGSVKPPKEVPTARVSRASPVPPRSVPAPKNERSDEKSFFWLEKGKFCSVGEVERVARERPARESRNTASKAPAPVGNDTSQGLMRLWWKAS